MPRRVPVALQEWDIPRDQRHQLAAAYPRQKEWLEDLHFAGLRTSTLVDYEWATAVLLNLYPDKEYEEFTDRDIMTALKTFAARSRSTRKAAYTNWFKWGYKRRLIPENPMEFVPDIRKTRRDPIEVFQDEEVERIIEANHILDRVCARSLFELGLRKAEARHLRLAHFDLVGHFVRVIRDGAKGGKERIIPVGEDFLAELATLELQGEFHEGDHIWYSVQANEHSRERRRSKPCGHGTFARHWEDIIKASGVRYRRPHIARHTFATGWRRKGLDLDEIQLLLGHESIRTTSDLYVQTDIRDVAAKMAALIQAGAGNRPTAKDA